MKAARKPSRGALPCLVRANPRSKVVAPERLADEICPGVGREHAKESHEEPFSPVRKLS